MSLQATADMRRITHRIAIDNPRAAAAWLRKLKDRIRIAGRSSALGRKVPELDREDIREAILGNYRIVYIVQARIVMVLRIFEGHDCPTSIRRDYSRSR
jgi:toxin ParE1/3/4